MFERLEQVENRFEEIEAALGEGNLTPQELTKLAKERSNLVEIVESFRKLKHLKKEHEDAKLMLEEEKDDDLRSLAKDEVDRLISQIENEEKRLLVLMLPKDPNDDKNVLLEIRAGTGGEEAALFAADLLRMYTRYAHRMGWRTEIMSSTSSSTSGLKESIMMIEGDRVFSRMKFESGTHRVQRVPETEAQGRIHTSACTVAILPEADEVEVNLKPGDLEISVCRSSGAGGQSVNTADSAVRIVHKPSGLVVECQDERSQLKNKDRALKILKARLLEKAIAEQQAAISANRKNQVGSGDRSERIRTYNFPQGRLTDHRINYTIYNLPEVMNGFIDDVLDQLMLKHQAELLESSQAES